MGAIEARHAWLSAPLSVSQSVMMRAADGENDSSLRWFYFLAICSQVVGVLAVVLLAIVFGHYRGGFEWGSDLSKVFNYHPLFMTLGMILFYGDAILTYRVFRHQPKRAVKIVHACLLASSLIFASVGLKAVFDSHNRATPPIGNLNSLHSWIGLTSVVLFGLQWVCGFVSFLFPGLSERIRKAYMPSHKFWGKVIFLSGVSAVLMGIVEYSCFKELSEKAAQKYLINFFGISVLAFAILVFYLTTDHRFQRPADHEPQYISLND